MARRRPSRVHGLVVVDKEPGLTSHDVVARLRRRLGERRIGHSGTLDPDATGVLLVGVGRATRLLRFLTALPKTYTTEIVLGTTTDTLDDSGRVTGVFDMAAPEPGTVAEAAAGLTGSISQVPPMVSAVRVGGRRLHEMAREGIEVERTPRPVEVYRFDVEPTPDPMVWRAEIECGSGTYVRVLGADLGERLGGGAHIRRLRRTAIGSFGEGEAAPLEEAPLLGVEQIMRDYPRLDVGPGVVADVGHGRPIDVPGGDFAAGGPVGVFDPGGRLLAVYERRGGSLRPSVVLAPA